MNVVELVLEKSRYLYYSIGMTDTKGNQEEIKRRIEEIKQELSALGPMRPGSISEQYNVCGTAGCRCKDPEKPLKHGPYYHLNYTWRGKSRTEFVRAGDVDDLRERLGSYKRFRALTAEWVDLSVELARLERAARSG